MAATANSNEINELATPGKEARPARVIIQLLLLALAVWAASYARTILSPLQEAIRQDLALSDNIIAIIQGMAFAVPMAVASVPVGLALNRVRKVNFLLVFMMLATAAALLPVIVPRWEYLLVSRGFMGLACAAVFVTAYTKVADFCAPAWRGRATMLLSLGEITGTTSAFALGGALLVTPNAAGHGVNGWTWALMWMALPLALVTLLMIWAESRLQAAAQTAESLPGVIGRELWAYRWVIVPLLAARILVWIADGAVLVWGAPMFSRIHGLSPEAVGSTMATILLIGGVAGPVLGGPLADYCQRNGGPRRTMTVLGFLAALSVPTAAFGILSDATLAAVALTAFLALTFTISVAAIALGAVVMPPRLRSIYMAFSITAAAMFAFGIAPLTVSGLSTLFGGEEAIGLALAMVCGTASALGAMIFLLARRQVDAGSSIYTPKQEIQR